MDEALIPLCIYQIEPLLMIWDLVKLKQTVGLLKVALQQLLKHEA